MRTVTPAQFAQQMLAMPAAIEDATREGVSDAALELTTVARKNIAAATGGDSRLSGVKSRSGLAAKVGARYKLNDNPTNPSALISAEGPLQLVERDTKPHGEIAGDVGRLRADSRGVVSRSRVARHAAKQELYDALFGSEGAHPFAGTTPLATPYGPRYRVQHPGTRGKHPFARAVESVAPYTGAIFAKSLHGALLKVIGR